VHAMPAVNVLYLPRDERLRTIVRTALDFIEEVYKDEIISDLKLVSFDPNDSHDVESVKQIAVREGFMEEVERRKKRKIEPTDAFFAPHYNVARKVIWIPVPKDWDAPLVLDNMAHEVAHHAIPKIPTQELYALAIIFALESGTYHLIERYWTAPVTMINGLAEDFASFFTEVVAEYVANNYFLGLHREPVMTVPQANMRELSRHAHVFMYLFKRRRLVQEVAIISRLFQNLAYTDMPRFRSELHKHFVKLIKKVPADVLESNRAKYGILYRRH
jgi:hypothetical protein